MRKAVFFDIDGTILDSSQGQNTMTAVVEKKIKELQEAGCYAIVATGRPYSFISNYLHNFGFDGFILSNGSQILMHNKTIYKAPIDKVFIKELVEALDAFQVEYILEGEKYSYMRTGCDKLHAFFKGIGIEKEAIKADYNIEDIDIFKIEVLCDKEEIKQKCVALVEAHEAYDYFFSIRGSLLEIHAKEGKKGNAVLKVLDYLDLTIDQSYAFGDGMNDVDMLETVGCGIAMANATDQVKAYSDVVTDSVSEDGVATGIEKYILNEEIEQVSYKEDERCS